jgi:hypothetical protein
VDAPALDIPSSFCAPGGKRCNARRNGANELKFFTPSGAPASKGGHALGGVHAWVDAATKTILEVDIFIATTYDGQRVHWHTPGDGDSRDKFHLSRIAAALTGHVFGMGHSNDPSHALSGQSAVGIACDGLHDDDEDVLSDLYPH